MLITLRRDRVALMDQLDALQMRSYFSDVICHGPELVRGKHLLQGVAELTPGGYAVGDTEADIELASETGRRAICLSYGVRSGRYLASRGAETVIGSLRELPEVIGAAERSGGPADVADVERGVALRNVHTRSRF